MTLTDLNRAVANLADRMERSSGQGDESVKELARGVNTLAGQMRAEQQVVREWLDEQAGHQAEATNALRDVASHLQLRKI